MLKAAVIKAAVPGWQQLGPIEVADTAVVEPTLDTVNLLASSVSGNAGVVGGQASYHIPIALPPGRNGVQPAVSLGYNSQNGNGIVGMGWSLNAGGAISRCAPTYAQDGFTQSVTFTNKDRYCLNGQRLILVDGVYRTEMDSFVVVTPTDAGFSVARPDGSMATYESADVLGWRLTQESWSGGKNTIDYIYDETDDGELVITQMNGPLLAAMPMGQPRTIKHNHSTPETLSFVDSPAPASPVYDGNGQFSFFSYFIDINGDGLTDVLGWKDRLKAMALTALTTPNIPTQARYIMCKVEALPASAP